MLNTKAGRLTVVELHAESKPPGKNQWRCICTCGGSIIATQDKLKQHRIRSCGCLVAEQKKWMNGIAR